MIPLKYLFGKTVAVMGLGKSGLATLAALKDSGVNIAAWDDNAESRQQAEAAGYAMTDLAGVNWLEIDALILSPGIPLTHPAPHAAAKAALHYSVPVIGDIELLFRSGAKARTVGITGTNGKSTTTALIGHILKSAGKKAEIGGNLGAPVLSFQPLGEDGFYVIEMSSYQTDLTPAAAFNVAVWLNITPDHIDRHGNLEGYINAKKKMFKGQKQLIVIGQDDTHSVKVGRALQKEGRRVRPISAEEILPQGVSAVDGTLYSDGKKIFSFAGAKTLPGAHNAQNIAAAYAACRELDLGDDAILKGILSYPGLPHRQQLVRTIGRARFINDSKATNADAASKALGCYENIYWIAGGRAKEGGLRGLEEFMPRVRHVFLIGEAAIDFAEWLDDNKVTYSMCETVERAVNEAARMAGADAKESVVLLSPACASFDQYKNYELRGEDFMKRVAALPETADTKVA